MSVSVVILTTVTNSVLILVDPTFVTVMKDTTLVSIILRVKVSYSPQYRRIHVTIMYSADT